MGLADNMKKVNAALQDKPSTDSSTPLNKTGGGKPFPKQYNAHLNAEAQAEQDAAAKGETYQYDNNFGYGR
jgi:hypothetical protein